ncbi:UPF0262 family protein [Thioclava sp. GXIMD2076]|uniref:UPF0262 protein VSX56_16860 n=1 Tax=Thioclava kandeliae TaxID=3070818 RepID=A0ABV1SKL1_9RHOB
MAHIAKLEVDDSGLPAPSAEIEQERRVAIFDLLEDNHFTLPGKGEAPGYEGPFHLFLAVRDGRLVFDTRNDADEPLAEFHLSFGPFRQVIKDYFQICESYFEAVKNMPPSQIEAIDMARRGIHNEGARILEERLEGKAELDLATARRLFTLVCVLSPVK